MSITVNTNMQALRIQNNLNNATSKMNTAMERMSSGYKINSSEDDAAGFAVSTKLETTISSSKVASANAQIGSNLLDSSEGSLDVILSNLQRIRDLTEQAATGTYSTSDKEAIATEVQQRLAQVDDTAESSSFNGINLFGNADLASNGLDLQVGTTSGEASTLNIDSSIFKGALTSQLGIMNVSGGKVYMSKADGTADTTKQVFIGDTKTAATTMDDAITAIMNGSASVGADSAGATAYDTKSFLDQVDNAINNVTERITNIGAYQNRLASVTEGLEVQQTNLTAANSTIKDADVAEESASYVQQQILQSASASLLTQANSAPQIALTLING